LSPWRVAVGDGGSSELSGRGFEDTNSKDPEHVRLACLWSVQVTAPGATDVARIMEKSDGKPNFMTIGFRD
jgi:hypothetical protein